MWACKRIVETDTDWKSTAVQWSEFEHAATLLKFRGGIVFAVATISAESCQQEAGAIKKFESGRSKRGA